MGYFFRKSIKLGGLRLNFSKSGIGYSAGFKGFRVGVDAKGRDYIHAGRNGFYYRKYYSNQPSSSENYNLSYTEHQSTKELIENIETNIESVEVSENDIINTLNLNYKKVSFLEILIWLFVIFLIINFIDNLGIFAKTFIFWLAAGFIANFIDNYRKTLSINYEQDNKTLLEAFSNMKNCKKIYSISATYKNIDTKYSSGATRTNISNPAYLNIGLPKYVKSNINVPIITYEKNKLYFFPDRILLLYKKQFVPIAYNNIWVENAQIKVVEDFAPADATIVDRTWKYTNKKGGPDKRFKNNYSCPICEYNYLRIKNNSGLDCCLYFSKANCCDEFVKLLGIKYRGAESIKNEDLQNGVCFGSYVSGLSNWETSTNLIVLPKYKHIEFRSTDNTKQNYKLEYKAIKSIQAIEQENDLFLNFETARRTIIIKIENACYDDLNIWKNILNGWCEDIKIIKKEVVDEKN